MQCKETLLRDELAVFRQLEADATDPTALILVQDAIAELEQQLSELKRQSQLPPTSD